MSFASGPTGISKGLIRAIALTGITYAVFRRRGAAVSQSREPHPETLELLLTDAKRQLEAQLSEIESINNRSGILLGFTSLVTGIVGIQGIAAKPAPHPGPGVLVLIGVLFLFTLLSALFASFPRNVRFDPDPEMFRARYLFADPVYAKRTLLANIVRSFKTNTPMIRRREFWLKIAVAIFTIDLMLIVFAYLADPMGQVLAHGVR
ncbi:MAG: hypothetical protein M3077_07150 [Candidatus Dormibacteraeota bacterium]|nr:hypothetical protein [Candidatus Dormibacteraeota bacterium]